MGPSASKRPTSAELRIDVTDIAPAGAQWAVAEVFVPPFEALVIDGEPVVAFCLAGGGFSRRYFDLDVPAECGAYSMARDLAARGVIVVTCDPLGIGASDRPTDVSALTPDLLADVQAHVTATVLDALANGTAADALSPLPRVRAVGVGHSAGALLTTYQQARHRQFAAVALLGFAGQGLVDFLTPEERGFIGDPDGLRAALPDLVTKRFGDALPDWQGGNSTLFSGGTAPEPVKDAMRAAQVSMLGLLGLTSMIPGASEHELAAIDVPIFLGVGSADITGPPRRIPSDFPTAHDITLFVLEGAGHTHNIHEHRDMLWARLAQWAESLERANSR